jgi:metal transporter CNNM
VISNAMAMEALPIFMDAIVPDYIAVLFSTITVFVFGEILP